MTPTPRTDAAWEAITATSPWDAAAVEMAEHARELERELEQIKSILANPVAVHLNMLRGTIKWTPANLRHLLGDTEPNNLEGPPPTDEERRENARAIQAMTVPERFRLMFGNPPKADEAGDPP